MWEAGSKRLADRELWWRLEQERERLRASLAARSARRRRLEPAGGLDAAAAEVAEWQAALDRLGEVEASLLRLSAGGLDRCQECGAPLDQTALEVLGWSVNCAGHGQRDLVGAAPRRAEPFSE